MFTHFGHTAVSELTTYNHIVRIFTFNVRAALVMQCPCVQRFIACK